MYINKNCYTQLLCKPSTVAEWWRPCCTNYNCVLLTVTVDGLRNIWYTRKGEHGISHRKSLAGKLKQKNNNNKKIYAYIHTYIVYSNNNNISKIVEKHCMQCVLFSQQFSAALPLVHSAHYYYYCCTSKPVHVCVGGCM